MINPTFLRDVLSRTVSVMREQHDDNGEPIATGNPELYAELVGLLADLDVQTPTEPYELRAIARARAEYATDDLEIDAVPAVSGNDEGGVWVAAWVYVAPEETEDEDEETDA